MQSNTAALFNSGPAMRLLEIALRAQDPSGGVTLDDELRRYVRVIRSVRTAEWNCSAYTAAGLLDLIAELLSSPSPEPLSKDFLERLDRAAEGITPAEYLRTLAGVVRLVDREPTAGYRKVPMGGWEADLAFPLLGGFTMVLDESMGPTAESAASYAGGEHPYCREFLASLAAEAHRALVLFPDAAALRANLWPAIPWISADLLRELLRAVDDHLLREHTGDQ